MIPHSLDFILRPVDGEQREYAARPHRSPCMSVQCATCYPGVTDGYNAAVAAAQAPAPAEEGKAEPENWSATFSEAGAVKGSAPEPEGEAGTGAGQSSASPSLPRKGGADTDSSDADAVGALASEGPTPQQEVAPDSGSVEARSPRREGAVDTPPAAAPRERICVGGLVGDTGIWWFGEGGTTYIGGQRGVKRGLDRITPERVRGVFVRLDHPETGRMDVGDMLYIEVGAVPLGENGWYREIISSRVVDREQFDRMTGIADLRRDLGWRD